MAFLSTGSHGAVRSLVVGSALVAGLLALDPAVVPAAVTPPRLEYKITKLANGLTVILSEDHSTPVVHVELWYHVGSKDEKAGRTWFAHML
jgi:zinc protease